MREIVLKVLQEHFKQYNDYKLSKIVDDIVNAIKNQQKSCAQCRHRKRLSVMSVKPLNLCQKSHDMNTIDANRCLDYKKDDGLRLYDKRSNSSFTKTFR